MKKRKLALADVLVTSFETSPIPADSTLSDNPTPQSGCFDCPDVVTMSCDHPCF